MKNSDSQPQTIAPLAVGIDEAVKMLGAPSRWAFHNEAKELGLIPYRRGKYRVRDIENALARAARRAQDAEAQRIALQENR